MRLLFELAKEYGELPQHEVVSILVAEQVKFHLLDSSNDVVVVDAEISSESLKTVINRVALSFGVDELFFWCDPELQILSEKVKDVELVSAGSVAVRVKNRSVVHDTQSIIRVVAQQYTKNRSVDLEHPDIIIRLNICMDRWYVGRKIAEISRSAFEHRRVHHRPFFSPISLHPKLARGLVNLSRIKAGKKLLDPFCGTGGILIEAGMVGAYVFGNDIEDKMIEGCMNTLHHFGIQNFRLMVGDVAKVAGSVSKVDAIVTDMPYGKSTTTRGESLEKLYRRAFSAFSSLLKDDGVVVAGGSLSSVGEIAGEFLTVDKVYPIRVHRSLTRYFICGHL